MKVLHTSDWHLGRTTYGHSRAKDHEAVLAEIAEIAAAARPDLIINSGDLFDQQRPPLHALRLATRTLHDLAEVAPVVIVCGNHDSGAYLNWLHEMLNRSAPIHFVTNSDDGAGEVLRFPVGEHTIHVAALPFISANRIVDVFDDPGQRRITYAEHITGLQEQLMGELASGFDGSRDVSVFAAHQYVTGAALSKTETHTSDQYATDPQQVPSVNYAAFGHIHKPQSLPTTRITGNYAGSPLQLDFGEEGEDKSIVVATLQPGQPAVVQQIPLTRGRRLRYVTGTLDEIRAIAAEVTTDICLVTVDSETHVDNLAGKVRDLLPDATFAKVTPNAADRRLELLTPVTAAADVDTTTMFGEYLATRGVTGAPADQVLQLFTTLLPYAGEADPPELPQEQLLADDPESAFALPAASTTIGGAA
ncbi:exonuclease SbcCD subunit D [Micromonospora sp. NBC_00898]|uniref:metallophosphoesterase family protein n=1 Tax=Micromonospora sp. NBC_00898 TaxID=2975981 RepID=UPI0038671ECA|nr:exonuclease SbcCD subunit D [Micromonospora sp. NBC_00898]